MLASFLANMLRIPLATPTSVQEGGLVAQLKLLCVRHPKHLQSHVSAHAELQWLLNCVTPIGWLNRMIQFKEKSRKQVSEA